ncbi:MAG: hypothetical protein WC898_02010, partial [Candidatus Paceibacterota bacterium]
MPRENRICIALFDRFHHFVKNRATWNFSRLFFHKFKGDVQIFSLGIVSQFSKLCLNTQNLLVLDISGLASIQKEFFIFHIIVHSNKNSFCISSKANAVKIASDFEPPPRRKISARQRAKNSEFVWKNGGKSVGRASRVPPSGFEKAVGFCFGVFIVPSSNLFPKSVMCHARSEWWLETESYARIVPPPP